MVRLNRIYTRTGDAGTTGLGDGKRVPKTDPRIEAYGTVDELSSVIGLALALPDEQRHGGLFDELLGGIQNDLFDVGADLCVPPKENEEPGSCLRVTPVYTERLEGWIDEHNEALEPLKTFVLPGGRPLAAWLHLARTVSRRAERLVFALIESVPEGQPAPVGEDVQRYLNRLSDLFFVLSRAANDGGRADRLWKPGGGR
ncbi:MAG: cob(I)yrinic acid a,c-diamide adenosyltransferase [Planctomycetota bacterium]|nr:cob(I)yrinic acid a,c-diamide adenosyltransferase [Planctomycetota bacterium]